MGKTRTVATVVASAVVALLVSGSVAWAGGSFSDVPPDHPFASEIEEIVDAGITTGFPDGTYRPSQAVTRGAMAAFMGRGFGRAEGDSQVDNAPSDNVVTAGASVQITAGAAEPSEGLAGGWVLVHATAHLSSPNAGCVCTLSGFVRSPSEGLQGPSRTAVSASGGTTHHATFAAQNVFPISAGDTITYEIAFNVDFAGSNAGSFVSTDISAVYVPFDGSAEAPL